MIAARTDANIVNVFKVFLHKDSIDSISAEQQFLLEAVLPNSIGSLLTLAFSGKKVITILWVLVGSLFLIASLSYLILGYLIDYKTVILTILFSYIIKILISWIGKSDSYLLAFLLISTFSRSTSIKAIASGCAALCHPQMTILALVFLESSRFLTSNKIQAVNLVGAAVGVVLDKAIFRSVLSHDIIGRSDYIANHIADMLFGGLFDAASLLTVTLVPPVLLFTLAGLIRPSNITDLLKTRSLPFYIALIVIFMISCFLTFDRSRVFVLATFPGYMYLLHTYRQELYAFLKDKTLVSSLIALLMLAMPQSDFTGWRGSSSVAKIVTRRLAPDVAERRFVCAPGCDPVTQNGP